MAVFAVTGRKTSRWQDFVHVPIGHIKTGKDSTLSPKQSIIPLATQPRSFHLFPLWVWFRTRKWQQKRHMTIANLSDPTLYELSWWRFRFAATFLFLKIFLTVSCLEIIAWGGGGRSEREWLIVRVYWGWHIVTPSAVGVGAKAARCGNRETKETSATSEKLKSSKGKHYNTLYGLPTRVYTRADYSINGKISPKGIPSFTRSRPPNYIIVRRQDLKRQEVEMM